MRRTASALAALAGATALALFVAARAGERGSALGAGLRRPAVRIAARDTWLARSRQAGASFVVVGVTWATITPQPATRAELADPGRFDANWAATDAIVRSAAAAASPSC